MMSFEKVDQLLRTRATSLRTLAKVAGGDPATFYRDANLSGADFRNQDLRGMSFDRADLNGVRINSKTKADQMVLRTLREEAVAAAMVTLRDGSPTAEEYVATSLDLISNLVALGDLTLASRYVEDFINIVPDELIGEVDPYEIATAKLTSSSAFVSAWFENLQPRGERYISRLAKSVVAPWPREASDWVADNIEFLETDTLLELMRRGRVEAEGVADWLVVEDSDERWGDVAAWGLAIASQDRVGRRRILSAILASPRAGNSELYSLISALTARAKDSDGEIESLFLNSTDLMRFVELAISKSSANQVAALEEIVRGLGKAGSGVPERGILGLLGAGGPRSKLHRRQALNNFRQGLLKLISRRRHIDRVIREIEI